MESHYRKLRDVCLTENSLRSGYPDWPYPLLFQREEITRDIFFLDPAIECGVINLGKNMVQDVSSHKYSVLNSWFHYRFFWPGVAAVTNSSEGLALSPRLYRLKAVLLKSILDQKLANYFRTEFDVSQPASFVESLVSVVSKLIEICSQHDVVIWGVRLDETSSREQTDHIRTLGKIPTGLIYELPHYRKAMDGWEAALADEVAKCRQAEAQFNKYKKRLRRPFSD